MKALETAKRFGRPSKLLDEDTATILLDSIRAGMHLQQAAALAGVGHTTFQKWMRMGEEGAEPYASFRHAAMSAEAMSEQDHVKAVAMAGQFGDWRASAWFLERRWAGKRWQHQNQLAISGEIHQKHVVLVDRIERTSEKSVTEGQGSDGRLPAPPSNGNGAE